MHDTVTREEVERWLEKVELIAPKIDVDSNEGESMLTNMKAYIADSRYFMENGDLVRGFEAIVWSWAIFEICRDLGVFSIDTAEVEQNE